MNISLIVAMTKERVIGNNNEIPWHLPEDLKYFKKTTMGKPMIMGRKTFDSIGQRVLPGRTSIILTNSLGLVSNEQYLVARDVEQAIELALAAGGAREIMVIGGAKVYQQFLPLANKLYLSIVKEDYAGDTYFPEIDFNQWRLVAKEENAGFVIHEYSKGG